MKNRDTRPQRTKTTPAEPAAGAIRASEELLIDALGEIDGSRIVCTSVGRAQFADAVARQLPAASVACHFLDLYLAERARQSIGALPANLSILCQADLPEEEFDLAALPCLARGEAELTRDLLQAAHQRLRTGGRMLASIDNPRDTWLHQELRRMFEKVTCRPGSQGVLYLATKSGPLRKVRNFDCEFAFRDRGRLFQLVSRPGVFSHRRLDGGARALMNAMIVRPGERVLEIGCGSGAVALAAAACAEGAAVQAIDSNPRAIQCTRRGADVNGLGNVATQLDADAGAKGPAAHYDLVLSNPPYYSQHRIAELFLAGAIRALKPGGRVQFVTKQKDWFQMRMQELFDDVSVQQEKTYWVVNGVQRSGRHPA